MIGDKDERVRVRLEDKTMTNITLKTVHLLRSGLKSEKNTDRVSEFAIVVKMIDSDFEAEDSMLSFLREHEARAS